MRSIFHRFIHNVLMKVEVEEKHLEKLFSEKEPKILVVSLHKSGTHLIKNILKLGGLTPGASLGGYTYSLIDFAGLKKNQYLLAHRAPAHFNILKLIEEKKIKVIFNYRDPRDVCVSRLNNAKPSNLKNISKPNRRFMKKVFENYYKSDSAFLDAIITGNDNLFRDGLSSVRQFFEESRGLFYSPDIFNVCFEDIIGPKGGGTRKKQLQAIQGLFEYLGLEVDANSIAENAYDPDSRTFHKGQIGNYKKVFTKKQLALFNKHNGHLLKDYKYK